MGHLFIYYRSIKGNHDEKEAIKLKVQNNRMKEKTGEGMEALVKGKAYGFAYSEHHRQSDQHAALRPSIDRSRHRKG